MGLLAKLFGNSKGSNEKPINLDRRQFIKKTLQLGVLAGISTLPGTNLFAAQTKSKSKSKSKKLLNNQNYLALSTNSTLEEALKKNSYLIKTISNNKRDYGVGFNNNVDFLVDISNEKYTSLIGSVNNDELLHLQPIIGEKTKNKNFNLSPQKDHYVQFTFNSDTKLGRKLLQRNIDLLKNLGYKDLKIHYGGQNNKKGFRILVGSFDSVKKAASTARNLLNYEEISSILLDDELGVVTPGLEGDRLIFDWEKIVRNYSSFKKNDIKKAKKKVAIKNKLLKSKGKKTYSFNQIENIIEEGFTGRETFLGKNYVSLLKSIAWTESSFNPYITSHKIVETKNGKKKKVPLARGLFQMTKNTAYDSNHKKHVSSRNLYNPRVSKKLAIRRLNYLKKIVEKKYLTNEMAKKYDISKKDLESERLKFVIAAYNGGPGCLRLSEKGTIFKEGRKMPLTWFENPANKGYKETRNYVSKVLNSYVEFGNGNKPK